MPAPHSVVPSITLDTPDPHFQGWVTFTVTVDPTIKHPLIKIKAMQGDVMVCLQAAPVGEAQQLGGGSSDWVSAGGGPAVCTADLYYNRENPTPQQIVLASCTFNASG